jgi:hypothetical protein
VTVGLAEARVAVVCGQRLKTITSGGRVERCAGLRVQKATKYMSRTSRLVRAAAQVCDAALSRGTPYARAGAHKRRFVFLHECFVVGL